MTAVLIDLSVRQTSYRLVRPFATALRSAKNSVPACDLRMTFSDGRVSTGISVPVVEVTGESIEDCLRSLDGPLRQRVINRNPDRDSLDVLLEGLTTAPAARSGLEMAWRAASPEEESMDEISILTDATVPLASTTAACAEATSLVEGGFTHLKIKADDRPDIAKHLQTVAASVPSACLRVDPNQSWSLERSVEVLDELAEGGVLFEFVEQPLPSTRDQDLEAICKKSPFPIAVDESARSQSDVERMANLGAKVVIVKIGKSGGWTNAVRMIEEAERNGMSVVVSSMLEPLPCVVQAARLARRLEPETVHDLDAALFFEEGPERYQPPHFVTPTPPW